MQFRGVNHFVPQLALRHFAGPTKKLWVYRILVSHASVPQWREHQLRGIAYQHHLYTRTITGEDCDSLERWLSCEVETPAAPVLEKVIAGDKVTRPEWRVLVRFLAAQDMRTPARFFQRRNDWEADLPMLMKRSLEESIRRLQSGNPSTLVPDIDPHDQSHFDQAPLRIKHEAEEDGGGTVRAEVLSGRALWQWEIYHALNQTVGSLYEHRWTVLKPESGSHWLTSDDPVLKVTGYGGSVSFNGGWASPGTRILMPLSAQHLLFTQIGCKPPRRDTVMDRQFTRRVNTLTARHAHRMIFASSPDSDVLKMRPRNVDQAQFDHERSEWRQWHQEQSRAEMDFEQADGSRDASGTRTPPL